METIVDEIKRCVCLDINSEEKVDIKESIVTLLQRLLKSLEHVNDRLVVKRIVPCGSMEEGTRNWKFSKHNREPIIEFDFLAVLNDQTDTKLSLTEHCSGYMAIMYKMTSSYLIVLTNQKLVYKLIEFHFLSAMIY